jgi:hypothetical protein
VRVKVEVSSVVRLDYGVAMGTPTLEDPVPLQPVAP